MNATATTASSEPELDQNALNQDILTSRSQWQAQRKGYQQKLDAEDRQNAGGFDYITDVPKGLASGFEGFVKSVGGLADHTAEFFGGDLFSEDELESRTVKTKTWVGGLTEGITEFAVGQAVLGPLGLTAGAAKLATLGKAGKVASYVAKNAVVDFVSFDGTGKRFSNILTEQVGGVFDNPVTRYLSAKEDDNWAEKRLKNSLEGLGLGWLTETVFKKLGIIKRIANEGETPELLAIAKELEEKSEHVRMLNKQIEEFAPQITPEQRTIGWSMWAGKARELGIEPDEFIKTRLNRIAGEADYLKWTGEGGYGLKQPYNTAAARMIDEALNATNGGQELSHLSKTLTDLQAMKGSELIDAAAELGFVGIRTKKQAVDELTRYLNNTAEAMSRVDAMQRFRNEAPPPPPAPRQTTAAPSQPYVPPPSQPQAKPRPIERSTPVGKVTQDFYERMTNDPFGIGPADIETAMKTIRGLGDEEIEAGAKELGIVATGKSKILAEIKLQLTNNAEAATRVESMGRFRGPSLLHQGSKEDASIAGESLEAFRRSEMKPKPLQSGDELVAERADIEAENVEASKIPLEKEPSASVKEIPLKPEAQPDPAAIPLETPPAVNRQVEVLAKGAVGFVDDTKAIMFLFKTSDFSTFAHESFHIWRRLGLTTEAEEVLARAVGQEAGLPWTEEAEEKAAQLWERYLAEGGTGDPKLAEVFEKSKGWMREVYGNLIQSDLPNPVSKEVKDVFDRFFTPGAKPAATAAEGAPKVKPAVEDHRAVADQMVKNNEGLDGAIDAALRESDARASNPLAEKLAQLKAALPPNASNQLIKGMAEGRGFRLDKTVDGSPLVHMPRAKLWEEIERQASAGAPVLHQTVRQRYMTVPAEIQSLSDETVLNAIKTGENVADALTETMKPHFNRLKNELGDANQVMDALTKVFHESFAPHVQGHEETIRQANRIAQELMGEDLVPKAIAKDIKNTQGLPARTVAYRVAMANEATTVHGLGNAYWAATKAGGAEADELLEATLGSLRRYEEFRYGFKQLQENIGRSLDAFNITVKPSAKVSSQIEKKIALLSDTFKNRPDKAEQVLAALNAANGDFGKLTGILGGIDRFIYSGDGSKSFMRGAFDAYLQVWTNGLLSGMRTFDGNFVSNAVNMFLSPAEQFLGSIVTRDKQVRTEAGMTFMNLFSQVLDFFGLSRTVGGINEAVGHSAKSQMMKTLSKNAPVLEASLSKTEGNGKAFTEWLQPTNATAARAVKALDDVTSIPSRMLMTADELFRQWQYRARLQSEGMLDAVKRGLDKDPAAFQKHLSDYVAGGFNAEGRATREDILKYVQEATMTSPLNDGFGKMLQDAAAKTPVLKLFLPFIRTPANIVNRAIQYTPGIGLLQKQMLTALQHPDAAIRSQAWGRQVVGGMFWTAAIGLAMTGRVTGAGPSNPAERKALLDTGWQPYSVVTKGEDGKTKYWSFKRLDPIGMLFGLAADFHDNAPHLKDGDLQGLGQAMLLPIASNLTNRTYMQGLSEFVGIMSQPDRKIEKFLQNRAASHVWTILSDMTDDEQLREVRSVADAVFSRIPWKREQLDPKRNILGEPVTAPMANNPVYRALSPVAYSEGVNDGVKTELANLRHGFSNPSKNYQGLDLTLFKNSAGQNAHDFMQEQVSKVSVGGKGIHAALEKLIASDKYQSLPAPTGDDDSTNPRIMAVNNVLYQYRQKAMEKTLKDYPEINRVIKEARKQTRTTPVIEKVINY